MRISSWARTSSSRPGWPASRSSSCWGRSARIRSTRRRRSARRTSGTAIPRRRTRRTASRRRRCSSAPQAYREQYGLNAITLLPVNLYGPRDNFDLETSHVVPALIRKMLEADDEVVLWGDGTPTREFLFVEDCAEGIALAAERYDGADPVNLGSGEEISIRDLAALVAELTGFEGQHHLGHVEAERPAAPAARHDEGGRALRLPRHDEPPRRARAHDRLVPRARARPRMTTQPGAASSGRGTPSRCASRGACSSRCSSSTGSRSSPSPPA